jgi:Uma2 family endonuclease
VFEGSEVQPDILVRQPVSPIPDTWDAMPVPFLVVEIASTSTRRRDLQQKRELYLDAGVAEYWIVDDDTRSIRIVRRGEERIERETVQWEPAGAGKAFRLDVAAYFDEATGDCIELEPEP